jgi:hypothetical protein
MGTTKQQKKFYSISEVADILKKSRQQVNLDCRLGKLPGAELVGKTWVIPVEALNNIIKPSK